MKYFCLLFFACVSLAHAENVTCEVLFIPYRQISLGFAKEGLIHKINAKEGDTVFAGNVLAVLEKKEEELRLEHVQQIIKRRKFEVDGNKKLLAKNMMSQDAYMEKSIELEVALIEEKKAMNDVRKMILKAPFTGTIVKRSKQEAEWTDPRQPIFELLDNSKIYAEALLAPDHAKRLRKGQNLEVITKDKGKHQGKVEFIDPRINPTSNLVRVKVLFENQDEKLIPGMLGKMILK